MSLPNICNCQTIPTSTCPFHGRLRDRTPEVQAHLDSQKHTYSPSVDRDLARRLEDQRNVARVVAADAIREIERILETGDIYCTREIVANLKEALTPGSFLHNEKDLARRALDSE